MRIFRLLSLYISRRDIAHEMFLCGMDLQRRLDSYELAQAYGQGFDDAKRGRPWQVPRWRLVEPVPAPRTAAPH
jgi:hypothetical protein